MSKRFSFLALCLALGAASFPASAQQVLPPAQIDGAGAIKLGPMTLGVRQGGKTTITPDTLQILGSGSTGDASGLTASPNGSAGANTLSKLAHSPVFPGGVQQPPGVGYYTNDPTPARVNRLDRLFMGCAAAHDGRNPNTALTKDPMELLRPFTTSISQLSVCNPRGLIAGAFFSQSSDNPLANSQGNIGIESIVNNNNTSAVQISFGAYIEARRQAGAGTTHAQENDIANLGNVVDLFPGTFLGTQPVGLTTGAWIASGAALPAEAGVQPNAASAAIAVLSNGGKFRKGIVFSSRVLDGMTGADNDTATGTAIAFGRNQKVEWFDASNNRMSYLYASGTPSGTQTGIKLTPGGMLIGNGGEYPVFNIINGLNGVNYPSISNAVTGTAPTLQANGTDANVPMAVYGKGSSGALTNVFGRTVDPTTGDIPSGSCADWWNSTTGVQKRYCNFGGTLKSITYQ